MAKSDRGQIYRLASLNFRAQYFSAQTISGIGEVCNLVSLWEIKLHGWRGRTSR